MSGFVGAAAFDRICPTYDVVIPCHDRAHCVADAVASVLMQEPAPARVIVVDDSSSDASADVIRDMAARFPTVTAVLLPRNGGVSNARNVGLALSRSPWIAFLDSDDVWLPGAARAELDGAAGSEADIIAGHFARVEDDGPPRPSRMRLGRRRYPYRTCVGRRDRSVLVDRSSHDRGRHRWLRPEFPQLQRLGLLHPRRRSRCPLRAHRCHDRAVPDDARRPSGS